MKFLETIYNDPKGNEPDDDKDLPTFDFDDPIIKGDQDIPDIR